MRKLNLGSGTQRIGGYISLDSYPYPEVDIVRDIEKGIPFDSESIDEIYTSHFLEHIKDLNFVMEECFRVLKKNGIMKIIVPYYKSPWAFQDPTHVRFFTESSFDYFVKESAERAHFRTKCDFEIAEFDLTINELKLTLRKK